MTVIQRFLGAYSPMGRVLKVGFFLGLAGGTVLALMASAQVAVLGGWDILAMTFLVRAIPVIIRSDATSTRQLSMIEDESVATTSLVFLLLSSGASIGAVAFTLVRARDAGGIDQGLLIALAMLSVALSWTVVNVVFTLRYARYHSLGFFGEVPRGAERDYRHFAYRAFTIGMCYSAPDSSELPGVVQRVVLLHALIAYVFGVVIIATTVNVIAGLG